ncbi:MAG: archease [Pirellulales bacterium]|nr:archease [Pirellulales bacterium]
MHEIFEHTADIGLRIRAKDLESLFAEAGKALFSAIVVNPEQVRPVKEVQFAVKGTDYEELLHDWLAELLFTFHAARMVFADFTIHFHEDGITAVGRGEPLDFLRHEIDAEIKAITWHELKIEHVEDGLQAEIIVDI